MSRKNSAQMKPNSATAAQSALCRRASAAAASAPTAAKIPTATPANGGDSGSGNPYFHGSAYGSAAPPAR